MLVIIKGINGRGTRRERGTRFEVFLDDSVGGIDTSASFVSLFNLFKLKSDVDDCVFMMD